MKTVKMTVAVLLTLGLVSTSYAGQKTDKQRELDLERARVELDGGDVNKIPVREEPGPDAEIIVQDVHSKTLTVPKSSVSFKWTELGYGIMTHKVIVPQLAAHTVFNHRNPGEDGPCLRSESRFGFPRPVLPGTPVEEAPSNQDIEISIKIQNRYSINREKNICKVHIVEDVRTVIGDEEFYHVYSKDMGFRYIADCPAAE